MHALRNFVSTAKALKACTKVSKFLKHNGTAT